MVATPEEIKEMETFFKAAKLPKEFILNTAIKFENLPQFVNQVIEGLKLNHYADRVAEPRWDDLKAIRRQIIEAENK